MANNDNLFSQYLDSNRDSFAALVESRRETFNDLVTRKREELGYTSEEKINDFVRQTITLGEDFDADTLFDLGRLGFPDEGYSFDAYETAKYDLETNALLPYLGRVTPKDGSKRSKKWDLHRISYAKRHGISDYRMVSQKMLNDEAAIQAANFKAFLYEGQDPDSPTVSVDIRQDDVGHFGRPIITVRNPITGKIINEVMNTPENNAIFFSNYNKKAWIDAVIQLDNIKHRKGVKAGQGFVDSFGKELSAGLDGLQATGYGIGALIMDAIPGSVGEDTADWFIKQYLRELESARLKGADLSAIENLDWSNPKAIFSKIGGLLGQALPSLALMFGGGGFGGFIAKQTAKSQIKKKVGKEALKDLSPPALQVINKIKNRGVAIGAYGSAMGMETGGIYGDVAAAGKRDWKAQLGALVGGTAAGALEAFYPMQIFKKLGLSKAGAQFTQKQLRKRNFGQNLKNVGKQLLGGGLQEGTTETLQFVVEEIAQDLIKHGHLPDFASAEFISGMLNSFVAGWFPGATISGSVGAMTETMNRLAGNKGAIKSEVQRIQGEAQQAVNKAAVGEGTFESEVILAQEIENIEAQVADLGINLDDTYNDLNNLDKGLFLSNALNRLEIKQKALPKGQRNQNVLNAKNTINSALEELSTGRARIDTHNRQTRIEQDRDAQIDAINNKYDALELKYSHRAKDGWGSNQKDKKGKLKKGYNTLRAEKIAKAEQVAANKISIIESRNKTAGKEGNKVIAKTVNKAINKIKELNKKLKNSNLSKRQRKELERQRNELGTLMDRVTRGVDGKRLTTLPKAIIAGINRSLNSFDFQEKIDIKTEARDLNIAMITAQNFLDELTAVLEAKVVNKDEAIRLIIELTKAFDDLQSLKNGLVNDLKNTKAKDAIAQIATAITDIDKLQEAITTLLEIDQIDDILGEPVEETPENLQSLNFDSINKPIEEETLKSLNEEDKEHARKRNKAAEAYKAIKNVLAVKIKSIEDVHKDIIDGSRNPETGKKDNKYKGVKDYLRLARSGNFVIEEYDKFLEGLVFKLSVWRQALDKSGQVNKTVYVHKTNFTIYEEENLPADAKLVEGSKDRYVGYWWIDQRSNKLIDFLALEIQYLQHMREVILDITLNVRDKTKTDEINTEILKVKAKLNKVRKKKFVVDPKLREEVEALARKNLGARLVPSETAISTATLDAIKEKYTEEYVRYYIVELYTVAATNLENSTVDVDTRIKMALDLEKQAKELIASYFKDDLSKVKGTKKKPTKPKKEKKKEPETTEQEEAKPEIDSSPTGNEDTTGRFKSVQRFKNKLWTRGDIVRASDTIFLFGDNLLQKGKGGQAIIRGLANAFGIPTKRKPQTSESSYFSDNTFEQNKRDINDAFLAIPEGKNIILSQDGLGTGLAQLEQRAPKTFAYLQGIIKYMEKNSDLPPYVVPSSKLSDLEVSVTDALVRSREELNALYAERKALGFPTSELAGLIAELELRVKRLEETLKIAKTVVKKKAKDRINNNILVKLKDAFNDLAGQVKELGGLKVVDLFRIKNRDRDSFFSNNSESTLNKETIINLLKKVGLEYTAKKDKKYIDAVVRNFTEFKKAFNEKVKLDLTRTEEEGGVYLNEGYRIFLDKQGNLPDEILFAMMLSTMHWSAINVNKSKFRPLFAIADLFYGDPKRIRDLNREQIQSVIDIGIFAKDAANDIGREILDLLNIKAEVLSEKEFLLNNEWAQINEAFRDAVVKDSTVGDRVGTSLALIAIQTSRYMNTKKGGVLKFNRIKFQKKIFALAQWAKNIKDVKGVLFWNTVVVNEEHPDLEIFKENADNLSKIKGDSTFLSDIYNKPVTNDDTQEKADRSFWNLPEKVRNLIIKLQNVQWVGKEGELAIFNILAENVLHKLVGIKNIDEQHHESKDGVEAANEEKRQNIQHVKDYINNGNKPFYFRFKAQIQHRLRIVSNTINGQTSKIHRALFAPVGEPSNINSKVKLQLFKLAVNQAFGHNIRTVAEADTIFNQINKIDEVQKIIEAIKAGKHDQLSSLINELISNPEYKDIVSASPDLLKGLVGLSQYNPNGNFKTTLTFETDGITNGYAIGLLQFLEGKEGMTIAEKAEYLKDALKRVGIFIDPNNPNDEINTYEKFLADGQLDIYQAFSSSIADAILNPEGRFKDTDREAIKILHGRYRENINSPLEKFARDLAKTPVMISNYGAGLTKVIDGIINKIIPDLYDKMASIQARYDKAKTETERVTIRQEAEEIQNVLLISMKVKVDLVAKLDKKGTNEDGVPLNLYGYTFSKRATKNINRYFDNVYRGKDALIENALEDLLAPIKASRELLTKVVEAEYFIFRFMYNRALAKLPNKSADQEAVRHHIAAQLADEFMPRMNGPWSKNEAELIQLIKSVTIDNVNTRIRSKHKKLFNLKQWKIGRKWFNSKDKNDKSSKETSVNSDISDFDGAGVSSVINMVQNMDSVLLGDLLEQKANVLPIFDAVEQRIDDAIPNAELYNNSMRDRNLDHSFLEQSLKQFQNIISKLKPEDLATINLDMQKDSFLAERLLDSINENISPKELKKIQDQIVNMTIEQLQRDLKLKIENRKAILEYIETKMSPRSDWRISQIHIPESILDADQTPINVEKDDVGGVETSAKNDEIETNAEIEKEEMAEEVIKKKILKAKVPFVWTSIAKLKKKTKAQLIDLANKLNIPFEENPTKAILMERIKVSQTGEMQKPIKPVEPVFKVNKLFIKLIKSMGGINPESILGKELKAQDITSKSMPGLFRKNSNIGDLDNIPVSELQAMGLFPEEDENGYATYDWVFERITDEVNGYSGLSADDQYIQEQYEQAIENYEQEMRSYEDTETLGSINIDIRDDLEEVYRTNSESPLRDNLQSIFDQLGILHDEHYIDKNDKENQQNYLQRVVDEVISKAGSLLDNTTVILSKSKIKALGEANIHADGGTVNVNFNEFKPISYAEQTAQEVYLHEILHVLTRYALKHDSKLKENLRRLRKQVIREIERTEARPYEVFLHKDKNGKVVYLTDKQAEIDAAKAQYNYVFGNKVPSTAVLDEFLAYSMTNKHLVAKLNTIQSEVIPYWSKEATDTVIEKLLKLFVKILDSIGKVLRKENNPLTVQEEIFTLTKNIVDINQSNRDSVGKALKLDKVGNKLDRANNIVAQFVDDVASGTIEKGSDAYIALVDKLTKDGKIDNFLANVLYDTKLVAFLGSSYKKYVDNHPEVQERLAAAYSKVNHHIIKNLSSLKSDFFGTVDQNFIELLYKSHDRIDSNRKNFKQNSRKVLQNAFKDYDSLTNREKSSITKILYKTDLSILVSSGLYTIPEVIELVNDNAKLTDAIEIYSNKLNIRNNSHYRTQATQLAKIMVGGKGKGYNQGLNATVIYEDNSKASQYGKDRRDEEIQDLDILISLLALKQTTDSNKTDFMSAVKKEYGVNEKGELRASSHNGIVAVINHHISFKVKSLEEGFIDINEDPNPRLMRKGYIANITNPDSNIEAHPIDKETMDELLRQKYEYIGPLEKIGDQEYGLFVLRNNPEIPRTKGALSMTSLQHKGMTLKEILSRDVKYKGSINQIIKAYTKKQTKLQKQGKLSTKNTMVPIRNENGEIVDYRIELNHNAIEKYLEQNLMFDQVMSTMISNLEDKKKTQEINEEGIKLLHKYALENQPKRPSKFVDILDDKYSDEYFKVLPEQAKYEIMRRAAINPKTRKEEFWVDRSFLDTVFGYQDVSISKIPFLKNMPKTKRWAKISEKAWMEAVRQAVVNIVVKIPIVPGVNFLSNFVTSFMYGVPLPYLVKKQAEGIRELNNYRNWANELQQLDFEILGNPALQNDVKTQNRREQLVFDLNNNPVAWFIDQGLFTSITEDINEDEFTYRNKIFTKIKETKGGKLVTGKAFDIANHLYLGERTAIFKASMHFLQMSDFIARYTLYSYQTEVKKMPHDKAYKQMIETFVNYDIPLNKYVAYGNNIGAILFVKYFIRIQRATWNLIITKPINASFLFIGNSLLGLDIETILDSSAITGNFFPVLGGFEKIFEEVLIPPGLEILMGEGIGIA